MVIHNKGPKRSRDTKLLIELYLTMCYEFKVETLPPMTIAKMPNTRLKELCKSIYSEQSEDDQIAWLERHPPRMPRTEVQHA